MKAEKKEVFLELKKILQTYESKLQLIEDTEEEYYLDTDYIMKNKKRLSFGSVSIKKSYVSFHLMPVYENPTLLNNLSPQLQRRMQGKSCFNFLEINQPLFEELKTLTQIGFESYQSKGYL